MLILSKHKQNLKISTNKYSYHLTPQMVTNSNKIRTNFNTKNKILWCRQFLITT